MRKLSDAAKERQYDAQRKWHKKNTEYINIGLRKGTRSRYNLLAEHRGVSLSSIVKECLDKECEREFGAMLRTFIFNGIEGQLLIENETPNRHGNIASKFTWGDIEEYPTFRSIEQAEAFILDEEEIACFIDQSIHNSITYELLE